MIHPAPVLPSNAPPLREHDNVHQASTVLQEHSGNRQHGEFSFENDYEKKYPSSTFADIKYATYHNQQQQPALQHHENRQLHHAPARYRHGWRYNYPQALYRHSGPERETRIRIEADLLYERFRNCDPWVKYRQRQKKPGNGDEPRSGRDKGQKWPEHLEKAFFRSLVQHPPMGKRKIYHKEKARGRNELISDCIEQLTGELRTRKQVSSHIQVLKPMVQHCPLITKYLSTEDWGAKPDRPDSSVYANGKRMSNYPVAALTQAVRATTLNTPPVDSQSLQKLRGIQEVFRPIEFQMFVQQKFPSSAEQLEEPEKLHLYTHSVCNPFGTDQQIADAQTFQRDFPLLTAMDPQRLLDCNILSAESSIAFPVEETWKKEDGSAIPGVELGVSFLCRSSHLPPTPTSPAAQGATLRLIVKNTFYENGVCLNEHSGASEARLEPRERGAGVETRIKFGSTFWAKTLGRLGSRLLDRNKDHRDDVSAYLKNITAVQEIFAVAEQCHECLLVIHWKFRLSTGTKGRASWSRLLLPTQAQKPLPKPEQEESMYEVGSPIGGITTSQQPQEEEQEVQPIALQSPFEYDSTSGSALSSATWPTTMSEDSFVGSTDTKVGFSAENGLDFIDGNIHLAYDPNLTFDNFDSSAFDFTASAVDFAAGSALQDYPTQWYDSYANGFETQQSFGGDTTYSTQSDLDGHAQTYNEYGGQYDEHTYAGSQDQQIYARAQDQQIYIDGLDQQAYGGAGSEMMKDDALVALADASYMASAMDTKQEAI